VAHERVRIVGAGGRGVRLNLLSSCLDPPSSSFAMNSVELECTKIPVIYAQRLFDYYQFVVGLGQCFVLSYLKAHPLPNYDCTILTLHMIS